MEATTIQMMKMSMRKTSRIDIDLSKSVLVSCVSFFLASDRFRVDQYPRVSRRQRARTAINGP